MRFQAGGALLSCFATMAQLLVVAAAVQPTWLGLLWAPALVSALVAALWGGLLMWTSSDGEVGDAGNDSASKAFAAKATMFSLKGAAIVAVLLTTVQVGVHALNVWLGNVGMMVGAMLAALADLHAVVAAVLMPGGPDAADAPAMVHTLMAAVMVHAGSKTTVAAVSGGLRYALWVGPGVFVHSLAFAVGLWLLV